MKSKFHHYKKIKVDGIYKLNILLLLVKTLNHCNCTFVVLCNTCVNRSAKQVRMLSSASVGFLLLE